MLNCTFARFWSHSSAYEPRKMSSAGFSGDGQDKFRWEGSLEVQGSIRLPKQYSVTEAKTII